MTNWIDGAKSPQLSSGDVHLWRLDLCTPNSEVDELVQELDDEERIIASCFREARHRRRFVAGRAGLRRLLARYTGQASQEICFDYGPHGKPSVAAAGFHFNFTHSHDVALFAITEVGEIGVDVEQIREWEDVADLAQHVFTDAELEDLDRLMEAEGHRGFFRLWTHKEAFIKATGEGVSRDLFDFSVDVQREQVVLNDGLDDGSGWNIRNIEIDAAHVAALALRTSDYRLHTFV